MVSLTVNNTMHSTVDMKKKPVVTLPPLDLTLDPMMGPGGGGMPQPGMRSRGAPMPMPGAMPGGGPPGMEMPTPGGGMMAGGAEIGPDGLPLSPMPMPRQPMPRRRLV